MKKLISLLVLLAMLLNLNSIIAPMATANTIGRSEQQKSDEELAEEYLSKLDAQSEESGGRNAPTKGTDTTLSAMLARAEAIVNYTWTPSKNISTWNGNKYNGLTYFPSGSTVKGVPYTLFTSEVVSASLCSLARYKTLASSNYSATKHCVSVGATRTGPVYGSCCADLVCEVFGGNFMNGNNMVYHSVSAIKSSSYGNTTYNVPIGNICAGDALSNTSGSHIIWVGAVTDTQITIYEQTPPVARKVTVNKSSSTNSNGYFVYGGSVYNIVTRSNAFSNTTTPPTRATVSTDKFSYALNENVTFSISSDGTTDTLWIYYPNGSRLYYQDVDDTFTLSFETPGHFQALVQTWNNIGSFISERIDFVVGPPTYARISTNYESYTMDETVTFVMDTDGNTNTLWIYCPDGSKTHYSDVGTKYQLEFDVPGHYQALVQTWNGEGTFISDRIDFVVGAPTYASVKSDKSIYKVNEEAIFTCASDGSRNTLWIYYPDGSNVHYSDIDNTHTLFFEKLGNYQAVVQAWNRAGSFISDKISFTVECGHSYKTSIVEPTCTTQGYTTHTCSGCGDSYKDTYTNALGHNYSYKVTTAPTTSATGKLIGTCSRCSGTTTVTLPRLNATDYTYKVTKAATCSATGIARYTWKTTTYGSFYFDVALSKTSHNYEASVTVPTCTAQGYTTYKCSGCGESYVADKTAATGHGYTYSNNGENHTVGCDNCDYYTEDAHEFIDGECICGATSPISDTALKFNMNISAGAEMVVNYNFMASVISKYEDFYLEVKKNVADGDPIITTYGISEEHIAMGTMANPITGEVILYNAAYTGINAKEMGDSFETTLYAIDANGKLYKGETVVSSIKNFLIGKLNDAASIPEMKTMAVDMLAYGAAAQIRFGYDTDNLVTSSLTTQQLALGTQEVPEAVDRTATTGSAANVNTNITINSKVELSLSCIAAGQANPAGVKCIIKDQGGKVLAELATENIGGVMYKALYDNVGAKEMREVITATFYNAEGTVLSKSVSWSVESYVAQIRVKSTATADEIAMVNAMLVYGDSVAAYMDAT